MFENPVMTDKPITVVLTTNMTHAIQSYLVSRKPDSCVQFDFMTGRELDIFHKDDNKQELRREWQDKLKETLDIPVKTPLQFYDVVTTYVNLQQISCSCRHNSVNSDIFHIDFTVAFQMQRWKYFHK